MGPRCGAVFDRAPHEGRPVNAVAQPGAARVEAPDEGHAVGHEVIEMRGDLAKVRIVPAQGDNVGVGEIDRKGAATASESVRLHDQSLVGGGEERRAEEVESSDRCRHAGPRYLLGNGMKGGP